MPTRSSNRRVDEGWNSMPTRSTLDHFVPYYAGRRCAERYTKRAKTVPRDVGSTAKFLKGVSNEPFEEDRSDGSTNRRLRLAPRGAGFGPSSRPRRLTPIPRLTPIRQRRRPSRRTRRSKPTATNGRKSTRREPRVAPPCRTSPRSPTKSCSAGAAVCAQTDRSLGTRSVLSFQWIGLLRSPGAAPGGAA